MSLIISSIYNIFLKKIIFFINIDRCSKRGIHYILILITNELVENINMGQNNYQILKIANLFLILLRNCHKNIQRENKNIKENKFFVFDCTMTHINENQI